MTLVILLAVCLTGGKKTSDYAYSAARKEAIKHRRPLLVYVGAEWCLPCRKMKANTLPKLKLKGVAFAAVDADRQPKLTRLLKVRAYPTMVLYVPVKGGWIRCALVGYAGPDRVEAFVRRYTKKLLRVD